MKTKQEIKKYFENGDKPTQEQFWEWQDSYWHKDENIPADQVDYDFSQKADLVDGKVPASQLPGYVDEVLECANLATFPVTGESDKLYIALDTNKIYRWSGSIYVDITQSEIDTLQNIVDRGNSTTKPIVFNVDQGRAGELNFNKTLYSYYFGNQSNLATNFYNVSIGYDALPKLTSGGFNVAYGSYAGSLLTTGNYNTFLGHQVAKNATTGALNTIIGDEGSFLMTTGFKNTTVGSAALYQTTTGSLNTALGYKAGTGSPVGDRNIFLGAFSGQNTSGSNNIIIGTGAGFNGGNLANKLIIHSNHTISGYSNTAEGNFGSFQQGQLNRALITGDFVDRWVRMNAGFLQIGSPASNTDDITITPTAGITAAKLYTPASNNDYVQRGWIFNNYYNQTQIDSLLSRAYRVMGSVANFGALPSTGQTTGDVWNLLDTGENYVWVDNLNNTGIAGWDKLSGMVDVSGYIPRTGTATGQPITGDIEFSTTTPALLKSGNTWVAINNGTFDVSSGTSVSAMDKSWLVVSQNEIYLGKQNLGSPGKHISISNSTNYIDIGAEYDGPGLVGSSYYGENYADQSFVQKKYIDKKLSYSTQEELTGGQWIDGKPIYKKTVKFDTIPSTGEIDLTTHFQGAETIVSSQMFTQWYAMDIAFAGNQWRNKAIITLQPDMAKIEHIPNIDYDYSLVDSFTLTLEYTKRTI